MPASRSGNHRAHGPAADESSTVNLDQSEQAARWRRLKPNTFWLQTAQDKFYPDFVARLKDGRTLVVEYKGGFLAEQESEKNKKIVGKTWAEASDGTCLFGPVTV